MSEPVSMPRIGLARTLAWLSLSLLIIVVDQWTKSLAVAHLELYRPVPVFPHFNFMLAHNEGAAFSFLADAGGWQRWFFAVLAVLICSVMTVWLSRLHPGQRWVAAALALVIGGALGNLWDRVTLGYVVDFLDFYWDITHFPAFNIADSAITVGAVMLIVDMLRNPVPESTS
ncbi:MAG: signal peptidase II [Pseudomonadota bacterium]